MMKKLFAIIMSMLMIACFMPTMAFAGEVNVASVGENTYASLQEAIDAAEANAEVKLLANVSLETSLEIKKDVTLNLDTYNITAADGFNGDFLICVTGDYKQGCTLTLSGTTGAIIADKSSSLGCVQLEYHGCGFHMIGGNLKNKSSYAVQSASLVPIVENGQATKWESINNASIIIDGGKIESSGGNGSIGLYGKTNLAVNGGTVESTARTAIYAGNDSTAVIKGENTLIKAKTHTIEARNGASVDIKENAKIQSTDGQVIYAYENAVISLDQADISANGFFGYIYAEDEVNLTVTGNTKITAAEKQPFYLADNSVLEISSADISYPANKGLVNKSGTNVKVSVTGGTFSSDVKDYVPSGMKTTTGEDGSFTVEPNENAVAQVGSAYYATLQEAITAVEAGQTIVLLQDVPNAEGIKVPSGKNFVLDFAQHTYTLTGPGAGSKNTETNGFQLLKDSTITFKNGTIRIAENANNVKRIIQNYANLTLENMQIYAENQVDDENYPLSFNNGNVVFSGNTSIITTRDDIIAFDVYFWQKPYPNGVSVTFDESYTGKINGKIVYDSADPTKASLTIKGNGSFGAIEESADTTNGHNISISGGTFTTDPTPYVTEDYKAAKGSDGKWTVAKKSSSSGGGGGASSAATTLDKAKAEANTALSNAAAASKYDDAEQAEVKSILEKAAADIKAAKTEAEVKAIQDAAQAEIDKVLTSEEKAEIEAVTGVSSDIFKAKSKYSKLNGKRAIKVTWNVPGEMKLDGYEVFRSTSRYSGFGKTPYFTTSKTSYTNNKELKTGKTYYYKVRGFVEINGVKYYTKFSTKAYRVVR